MITEAQAEKALDYLRDSASDAAAARANRIVMEEYRKVVKAEIMAEHADESLGAQERIAYAHPRYREHLVALQEAIRLDSEFQFYREGADAKLRAFQTQSANERAQRV